MSEQGQGKGNAAPLTVDEVAAYIEKQRRFVERTARAARIVRAAAESLAAVAGSARRVDGESAWSLDPEAVRSILESPVDELTAEQVAARWVEKAGEATP